MNKQMRKIIEKYIIDTINFQVGVRTILNFESEETKQYGDNVIKLISVATDKQLMAMMININDHTTPTLGVVFKEYFGKDHEKDLENQKVKGSRDETQIPS